VTAASPPPHDVADLGLAPLGRQRIEWADRDMPVLRSIRERFARETPLAGLRISACLHVTTETAALARTLRAGGADLVLVASNPLSTQDDVAAALVADFGVATYARRGEDEATYYRHVTAAIDHAPRITMDDGADVIGVLHGERREMLDGVIGGTEDTTTGVIRLRALEREGGLAFPVISVNDADTSHMFDNTGQSTIDGLLRATNLLVAGRQAVVAGFGPFGRGVAGRLRGMGAHVIVLEVDPRRALEAVLDGFPVMPVAEAARLADVFITATGDVDVLRPEHMREMKDGAILANTGHFNVEIDVAGLAAMARAEREVRPGVREFLLPDGRRLNLLAEGRLVNLACAEGHPASVMDMSFANQALCAEFLAREGAGLEARVYPVPPRIDEEIAKLKLAALGVRIDVLTDDQARYLASWEQGT
jgi:adenosylhomocysteinase